MDLDAPAAQIPNFVRADERSLPFRNSCFPYVFLFNVLEHIDEYEAALYDAFRVCSQAVIVRTDKLLNLSNWFTVDHKYLMIGCRFVRYPRPLKFLLTHVSVTVGRWATKSQMAKKWLRQAGLLPASVGRWNYYSFVKLRTDYGLIISGPVRIPSSRLPGRK